MSKAKHVYVAGPLTGGHMLDNVKNAVDAGQELRDHGYVPFVPHANILWELMHNSDYEEWMEWDLAWLDKCDALLRLPGHSPGADREVAYANEHSIPVFTSIGDLRYEL